MKDDGARRDAMLCSIKIFERRVAGRVEERWSPTRDELVYDESYV